MNRLALIAATGFLTLSLTGCGESGSKPTTQPTENTTNITVQPAQPAQPAQEPAAPAPQQQPAEGQSH